MPAGEARPGEVTALLAELKNGRQGAAGDLLPLVYQELRRLARHYMRRERADHTLQATALVHEAYLRLIDGAQVNWQNRAHFLGVAAMTMRRLLVDHARARGSKKRGGEKVPLDENESFAFNDHQCGEIVAIDVALSKLAKLDERQARVVEMRFFGGLSVDETAEALAISPTTVKREWMVARAWLRRELGQAWDDTAGLGEGQANRG